MGAVAVLDAASVRPWCVPAHERSELSHRLRELLAPQRGIPAYGWRHGPLVPKALSVDEWYELAIPVNKNGEYSHCTISDAPDGATRARVVYAARRRSTTAPNTGTTSSARGTWCATDSGSSTLRSSCTRLRAGSR
ncbi:hypothetical protein MTO96_027904 [Rhipicephalus appendiculatus]